MADANQVQDEPQNDEAVGSEQGRHTLSLYVANKPGVLIRIALVFAS